MHGLLHAGFVRRIAFSGGRKKQANKTICVDLCTARPLFAGFMER